MYDYIIYYNLIWFIFFAGSLPTPEVATIQNILDNYEEHEEKESRANGHVSNFHVLRFSPLKMFHFVDDYEEHEDFVNH